MLSPTGDICWIWKHKGIRESRSGGLICYQMSGRSFAISRASNQTFGPGRQARLRGQAMSDFALVSSVG